MKKIAVILAGCGSMDGSEIHESTLLLYALSKAGVKYEIFAPNKQQADVINFVEGVAMSEKRNVLLESARIARGEIQELTELEHTNFDALILPGGFGAAKNLFTFALDGLDFVVDDYVEHIINSFNQASKPIGAMCIAPMVLAKVLAHKNVEITLGPTTELCTTTAQKFGVTVTATSKDGVVVDRVNKVVTTPAYMYGDNTIAQVGAGAENLVTSILELI
ncbi:MAG: isoprenoid biosynthesis glyoxalase ElbB [Rikenellaceae bacterium]